MKRESLYPQLESRGWHLTAKVDDEPDLLERDGVRLEITWYEGGYHAFLRGYRDRCKIVERVQLEDLETTFTRFKARLSGLSIGEDDARRILELLYEVDAYAFSEEGDHQLQAKILAVFPHPAETEARDLPPRE
jgi:hypothetical protein